MRPAALFAAFALIAGPAFATDGTPSVVFQRATPDATVSLKLPDTVRQEPRLWSRLVRGDEAVLTRFLQRSRGDAASYAAEGRPDVRDEEDIAYELAGRTGRLVGLIREGSSYSGGAHPNPFIQAVLWDRREQRIVDFSALFRKDADYARLDAALCEAVTSAKAARQGALPIGGPIWKCPTWRKSQAVLAPGTVPGKAGGLIFLFGPYEIGPYSEGEWRVAVPLGAFRSALSPAYAQEFAGGLLTKEVD